MPELLNTLENLILRNLSIHHAIGENNLYEMCRAKNSTDDKLFVKAIAKLYTKGLIDITTDPTNTMKVVRMKYIYQ